MAKRDAPDSGFDTSNPSKRHLSDPPSSSHSAIEQQVTNGSSAHDEIPSNLSPESPHDIFLPETEPAHSAKEHDEFVPSEIQRNELAAELAHLQAKPTATDDDLPTYDDVPTSPIDLDHEHDHNQRDEHPAEQTTPQSSPGRKHKKANKKLKVQRVRKAYVDPLFWPEGLPDREAELIARISKALICGTTGISLDTEPLLVNGTVWKEVLANELQELYNNGITPLLPEQDKFDFLKASFRLGSLTEPNRMSRLLGGGYRSPEYCSFLLQGFLGLLHSSKVRRALRGNAPERPAKGHSDLVVNADQLYPSDDELIMDQEANPVADPEGESIPDSTDAEIIVLEESDREEEESHGDSSHTHRYAVHESRHRNPTEQRFLARPSYVLRNYMSIVSGQEIKSIEEFGSFIKKVGGTFLEEPWWQRLTRLKWLKEKMPAPDLGPEAAVSEPILLWNHAMKTYSAKNLARCALIQTNCLLDWLGFVANESVTTTSEKEYFEHKRPVVSIAPVPMLYLADKAVDFVLRVLTLAVQTEQLEFEAGEEEVEQFLITDDDVISAAYELVEDPDLKRSLNMSEIVGVLGNEHSFNDEWPSLLQRPLTGYETAELCERTPKVVVSIPTNVTEEMRAVVMSFRNYVKSRIYAKPGLFKVRDPFSYMSGPEIEESKRRRRECNRASGINWGKSAEEQASVADGDESEEDDVAKPGSLMKDAPLTTTIAGREEGVKHGPPNCDFTMDTDSVPATARVKSIRKLPAFFDQVNFAELVAFRLGNEETKKRKQGANKLEIEDPVKADGNAALFLKQIADGKICTTSTVCFHRLGWICLHALGISIDKGSDRIQSTEYGCLAGYTNFAQFRGEKPAVLTKKGLYCLAQIADTIVRSEGELLMSCAAHDDGRPWIDRADVALMTSVRKDEFHYSKL